MTSGLQKAGSTEEVRIVSDRNPLGWNARTERLEAYGFRLVSIQASPRDEILRGILSRSSQRPESPQEPGVATGGPARTSHPACRL